MSVSVLQRLRERPVKGRPCDYQSDIWGLFFVNMGGPESTADIRQYLVNIFSDRSIIKLPVPAWLQRPLAKLITALRTPGVSAKYNLIGGGSPLLRHNRELAHGVSERLSGEYPRLRTYTGMRYSDPLVVDELRHAIADECRHLVVLPMYPQYCNATTGTALEVIADYVGSSGSDLTLDVVADYHDHPGFISLLRKRIRDANDSVEPQSKTRLLFSAHSIPESLRESGDPYIDQIVETCRLAGEGHDYLLTYQSRTGPVKWVGPDTMETIADLASRGIERVIVVPISFVSDNIETLYDIDIVMQRQCRSLEMKPLVRTASFNSTPDFVDFIATLVRERVGKP